MKSLVLALVVVALPGRGELAWKPVQYLGGAPGVRVNRSEPDHLLVATPETVVLKALPVVTIGGPSSPRQQPRTILEIPVRNLMAVTYAGFRRDRPAAQAAIGIPHVWPKSTDHFVVVEYRLSGGGEAEILLCVHKKHYKEIVAALSALLPER